MTIKDLSLIINSIRKENDLDAIEISATSNLRKDLDMDSYDLAQLTVLVESKTNIDIFEKKSPVNIGDILECF